MHAIIDSGVRASLCLSTSLLGSGLKDPAMYVAVLFTPSSLRPGGQFSLGVLSSRKVTMLGPVMPSWT